MRRTFFCFFALMLAFVLTSGFEVQGQGIGDRNRPADGGDGSYGLQGRVYLPNGKPAVNASVAINSADSIPVNTRTDLNGVFQIGSLRAGNYTVIVRAEGFPTEQELVIIDRVAPAGRTFTVVVNIRPDAREAAGTPSDSKLAGVPKAAAEKYQRGVERLKQNDTKGAVSLFDEAIAVHPTFAAAHYEKGAALLKENNLDNALAAFVRAIEIDQKHFQAKYSVGYTHYLKKNYEVAAAVFADVIKQQGNFAEAYMYLGISYYYLKDNAVAEKALKAAISLKDDPSTALAHRFLGGMYIQGDRKAEAAMELQKYLDLVPNAPDASRLKATVEDLKKKF